MVAHAIQDRRGVEAAKNIAVALFVLSFVCIYFGKGVLAFVLLLFSIIAGISWEMITRPPTNNPANFLQQFRTMNPPRPCLVCLGDSLTMGRASDDWTVKIAPRVAEKMKFERPEPADFQSPVWVVNAAQNSITSWVVLQERLQACMACYPDFIVILIGTNDVLSVHSPQACRDKVKVFNLPENPSVDVYKKNLKGILEFLTKASPKTEIGVCTLPPLGENLGSDANKIVKQFNEVIRDVVEAQSSEKVNVVDVGERLQSEIIKKNDGGKKAASDAMFLVLCLLQVPLHFFFGLSWNALTSLSSGSVLFDTVHMNETGGDIVADAVTEWLFSRNVHKAIAVKQF